MLLSLERVRSLVILLQFDGSLRPPRDYNKFCLLDDSQKLASCSATISLQQHSGVVGGERMIAIGGKFIQNEPFITSADTEYEGLILGLDWLVDELSSESTDMLNEGCRLGDGEHLSADTLIIRGDCKSVIDQINSRSIPRKMQTKYNLAMDKIDSIKQLYAERYYHRTMHENLGTTNHNDMLSVHLEHVQREYNTFCDAICKLIINKKQADLVVSIQDLIQLGEEDILYNNLNYNNTRINHIKKKRKKSNIQPKSSYFLQAVDEICDNPHLCNSSRIALACVLTKTCIHSKDSAILDRLSSFILNMSRKWSKVYYAENDGDTVGRDILRKVSIDCGKLSKQFTDATSRLYGDNEPCLKDVDSIFEFCTGSKHTTILDPYEDISHLMSSLSNSERIKAELWNQKLGTADEYYLWMEPRDSS